MLSPSASPHPSASANAHAASRPSASAAASPWASGVSAAKPSGSLQPSSVKAARANVEYVKRKIQDTPWEVLDSRLLCPLGETACPMYVLRFCFLFLLISSSFFCLRNETTKTDLLEISQLPSHGNVSPPFRFLVHRVIVLTRLTQLRMPRHVLGT